MVIRSTLKLGRKRELLTCPGKHYWNCGLTFQQTVKPVNNSLIWLQPTCTNFPNPHVPQQSPEKETGPADSHLLCSPLRSEYPDTWIGAEKWHISMKLKSKQLLRHLNVGGENTFMAQHVFICRTFTLGNSGFFSVNKVLFRMEESTVTLTWNVLSTSRTTFGIINDKQY